MRNRTNSTSHDCLLSFGKYQGDEYKNKKETVGNSICLVESKWMKVQQHAVKIAGQSSVISDWLYIDYHNRVNVLVEDERKPGQERRFLVLEQSKYALNGQISLAVVGGIIEPGESAELTARREVEEEMGGMHCEEFHFLGEYRTDVNRGMGMVHSFLATHCSRSHEERQPKQQGLEHEQDQIGAADSERQDLKSISLGELRSAVVNGKFREVQWSNTVALALLHPELMD